MNDLKRIIAIILLGSFVFTFLHSELGFLDFDGDNHSAHDFCEIVKNIHTHSQISREELPKLEFNKDIFVHCFESIQAQTAQTSLEISDHHLKAKPVIDLFLFNRILLI